MQSERDHDLAVRWDLVCRLEQQLKDGKAAADRLAAFREQERAGKHPASDSNLWSTVGVNATALRDAAAALAKACHTFEPPMPAGMALTAFLGGFCPRLKAREILDCDESHRLRDLLNERLGPSAVPLDGATFAFDTEEAKGRVTVRRAAYGLTVETEGGPSVFIDLFYEEGVPQGTPRVMLEDACGEIVVKAALLGGDLVVGVSADAERVRTPDAVACHSNDTDHAFRFPTPKETL
jgi:hypothetical protein